MKPNVTGALAFDMKLVKTTRLMRDGLKAGLEEAMAQVMDEAKERVPEDYGDLHDSGYVGHAKIKDGGLTIDAGFGGPAAPYALVQHEREDFNHTKGEAKYFEKALDNNAAEAEKVIGAHLRTALSTGVAPKAERRHRRTPTTAKTRRKGPPL